VITTIVAVVVFLLLAVPGIVYELGRQTAGHTRKESAFQETARILLAGLGISAVTVTGMVLAALAWPPLMPDFAAWLAHPSGPNGYLVHAHATVARAVAIEVLVACGIAWLANRLSVRPTLKRRPEQSRYVRGLPLNLVLADEVPLGMVAYISARLEDGTRLSGYSHLWSADANTATSDSHLVLRGPALLVKPKDKLFIDIGDWDRVVVPLADVAYLQVAYRPAAAGEQTPRAQEAVPAEQEADESAAVGSSSV
jgi:hypothetical protein